LVLPDEPLVRTAFWGGVLCVNFVRFCTRLVLRTDRRFTFVRCGCLCFFRAHRNGVTGANAFCCPASGCTNPRAVTGGVLSETCANDFKCCPSSKIVTAGSNTYCCPSSAGYVWLSGQCCPTADVAADETGGNRGCCPR
jgi:hypothetical protein